MIRRTCCLVLFLATIATGALAAPGRVAVHARVFDGRTWLDSATVIVSGERIESIVAGNAAPSDATLIDIAGATLTPGFIDCDSALGIARGRDERAEAASPDLRLADAFEPDEGESEAFRRSGVTLAWLAAGPASVVGARGALVQPSATGPARVLDPDHGACGSLAEAASIPDRAPTSVPEQAELIASRTGEVGTGPLRVRFDDAASARLALELAGSRGLVVGLPSTDAALEEIAARPDARTCLSGLGPSSSIEQLRLAVAAMRRTNAVLGTGNLPPGPRALRWAAARLVAEGAEPDRVLAGLTSAAARAVDAGPRGVIAPGAIADLVLWSGDPLSPASRPLRAWVSGEQVHAE